MKIKIYTYTFHHNLIKTKKRTNIMSTFISSNDNQLVSSIVPNEEFTNEDDAKWNESLFIGDSDEEGEGAATRKQDFIESQQEIDIRKELIRKNLTKEELSTYIIKCKRELTALEKEYRIAKERIQATIVDQQTTNEDSYEFLSQSF